LKKLLLPLLLFAFLLPARGQFLCGVRWVGLSAHLGKVHGGCDYRHKLCANGRYVCSAGWSLLAGYVSPSGFGIQLIQGFIPSDCSGKHFGMTHAGILWDSRNVVPGNFLCGMSLGPMWFYRQSWKNNPGYVDDGTFRTSRNGRRQKKFVWYGGQFYGGYCNPASGIQYALNILPAVPQIITLSPGVDYRFLPKKTTP